MISVIDTGIGISSQGQQKLFQSFSQVDASTTRQYGGTGLGLAICKQLVELMGGEIGVESVLGSGSKFWLTATFEKTAKGEIAEIGQSLNLPFQNRRFLVADDCATICQILRQKLEDWGAIADVATDLTRAIRAWREAENQQPYDAVIFSEKLASDRAVVEIFEKPTEASPHALDSCAAAESLHQFLTKLIVTTTINQRDRAERLLDLGACGYLIKPIKESHLLECLNGVLFPQQAISIGVRDGSVLSEVAASERAERLYFGCNAEVQNPSLQPALSAIKILVVEDNPINQEVVFNQLEVLGYQADCAANGQEGLTMLARAIGDEPSRPYDIVLMDCQMPVLDGYEATRQLRQREGSDRHTIVIALTAHAMKADREKCLAAGMDDYISKPVDLEELGRVLERWTNRNSSPLPPLASSPSPSSEESPLDLERLHKISRGKVEFQERLLRAFVESAIADLEATRRAIANQDCMTIEQQAHRLKGSAANVGAKSLCAIAAELEQKGREKILLGTDELLMAASNQLDRIRAFISLSVPERNS